MVNCLICENRIDNVAFSNLFKVNVSVFCEACMKQFDRVIGGCHYCGRKTNQTVCEDCLYWKNLKETKMLEIKNHALYYYNTFAKSIINRIKFSGDCRVLNGFKEEIRNYFIKYLNNHVLIPVPVHENRLLERGFNQSLMIAKLLPYKVYDIIEKKNESKQSKKSRYERVRLDQDFSIKEMMEIKNKKIVIIDDIYTTGATIKKIGKLLYENGFKYLSSFTLFRS